MPLSPRAALYLPLEDLSDEDLKFVYGFAEGEVRRSVEWGAVMDKWERRRKAAEDEMWRRKNDQG